MHVDIFYAELNYEMITERPTFALLSLLSEVGGFLGLLLGDSVLTVCELVDYLALTFLRRVKGKQQILPNSKDENGKNQ